MRGQRRSTAFKRRSKRFSRSLGVRCHPARLLNPRQRSLYLIREQALSASLVPFMPGIESIKSLLQHASVQGSKSTALNPLGWGLGIVLSATLTAAPDHPPFWLTPCLGAFSGLFMLAYLVAYFILLFKDRDALRSENINCPSWRLSEAWLVTTSRVF